MGTSRFNHGMERAQTIISIPIHVHVCIVSLIHLAVLVTVPCEKFTGHYQGSRLQVYNSFRAACTGAHGLYM